MRKLYLILIFAAIAASTNSVSAQHLKTTYFMKGTVERSQFNPAFAPSRGYITIPVIGGMMLDYKSNSLAVNTLLYPNKIDGGEMVTLFHRSVRPEEVLPRLSSMNSAEINMNVPVLGFGMNMLKGKGFLSFDVSARVEAGIQLPYGLFEFVKLGSGNGSAYDISNLAMGMSAYAVASLGYAHRLPEYNLTVGGKVNFLLGLARVKMHYDHLNVEFSNRQWSVEAQGGLDIAVGDNGFVLDDDGYVDIGGTFSSAFKNINGLAGFGVTVDLGAEYKIMDMVTVSASILDLGYMKWGSSNVQSAISDLKYSFTGFNIVDGEDVGTSDWEDLEDFTKFTVSTDQSALNPKHRATFLLGANAPIPYVEDYFNFGLMFMDRKTEFLRRTELTAILTATPLKWLNAGLSYSVARQRNIGRNFINTIGFTLSTHTYGMNFTVGTDYIITKMSRQGIPAAQKAFNIYFGLSVPIGSRAY